MEEVDILHPQTVIQWTECSQLPEGIDDTRCMLLNDKLYVGGRVLSSGKYTKLFVSSTDLKSWSILTTPCYWFALTIFESVLLLLGGVEKATEEFTNKIWGSKNGKNWEPNVLPPMRTKRISASAITTTDPECIIVAGGEKEGFIPTGLVEVFVDEEWAAVQPLPKRCYDIKFTIHYGKIYLLGGYGQDSNFVYWSDVKSIINAPKEPRTKGPKVSLWGKFDLPLQCSNTASFGQQLITMGMELGIDRTKIHARFPLKKVWVHVGNIPADLRNIYTTVLPTREMVVIGVDRDSQKKKKRRVFKASLKMIPYHPKNWFTMSTLSKLEGVSSINVVSSLSIVRTKIASVAEITLDMEASMRLGYIENPKVYVEIVIGQWEAGRSHRSPTWIELLTVLKMLGLQMISQEIEDYMRGKLRFLDAYNQILDTRECIEMWFVKVILLGASRLGKTTACRRLSGDIRDISSSEVGNQPSTGIVESGRSVIIRYPTSTTATVLPSEWTTATDLNAEACMFLQYFYGRNKNSSGSAGSSKDEARKKMTSSKNKLLPPNSECIQTHSLEKLLKAEENTEENTEGEAKEPVIDTTKVISVVEILKKAVTSPGRKVTNEKDSDGSENIVTSTQPDDDEDTFSTATESEYVDSTSTPQHMPDSPPRRTIFNLRENPVCPDDSEVSSMFRKAMDSKHWTGIRQYLKDITFLKMEDTGGQPEFMDMLPALTIGPGLYLLFCKLTEELQRCSNVTYVSASGQSTTPEESIYSVEETLLTALASIACFHTHTSTSEVSSNELFNKSVAYIIGTHKDQVTEEEIEVFDKKLQESVHKAEFFRDDLVQFSSENRMVFPIDNMYGGEEEVKKIRNFIEEGMKEHFKKLSIPAAWLVLSLCLRKREERTASLQSVHELAEKLGMLTNETNLALWFLHHYAGVVMYFPEVVELKDTVICDSQIVYDSVTNLIVNTFRFGQVGKAASEKFRETGQFSLKDIEKATRKFSGDYIPLKKLVKLLEHLNIISSITLQESQPQVATSTQNSDMIYFMPCVLQSFSHDQIEEWWKENRKQASAAPIFIQYSCGVVPLGIFPALITNLARQRTFRLVVKGIRKNRVIFKFGNDKDIVTFVFQPKYFAVHFTQQSNVTTPTYEVCTALRGAIESTLKTVISRTNYNLCAEYQLSFECPTHLGREHLCVVEASACPHNMSCQKPGKGPKKLPMKKEHLVWFRHPDYHNKDCPGYSWFSFRSPNRRRCCFLLLTVLIVGGVLVVALFTSGLWLM